MRASSSDSDGRLGAEAGTPVHRLGVVELVPDAKSGTDATACRGGKAPGMDPVEE